MKFLGLRSLIYPTKDIVQDKVWWEDVLGKEPYYASESYVGFDMNGYEIGISSSSAASYGQITYIGVDNVEEAINHFLSLDCEIYSDMEDVGEGIIMAVMQKLYDGQLIGLIYNPHFKPR